MPRKKLQKNKTKKTKWYKSKFFIGITLCACLILALIIGITYKHGHQVLGIATTKYPASADLSRWLPPVGLSQGINTSTDNSCVGWAIGYFLRGWYARRDGYYPPPRIFTQDTFGGFAPLFLYSQVVNDFNLNGRALVGDALKHLQSDGIDTRAHYKGGNGDYVPQGQKIPTPDQSEFANAKQYKINGSQFDYPDRFSSPSDAIKDRLSSGNPVAITMDVDNAFQKGGKWDFNSMGSTTLSHEMMVYKYDSVGVWVANSWGNWWGNGGKARISWSLVNDHVTLVASISVDNPYYKLKPLPTNVPVKRYGYTSGIYGTCNSKNEICTTKLLPGRKVVTNSGRMPSKECAITATQRGGAPSQTFYCCTNTGYQVPKGLGYVVVTTGESCTNGPWRGMCTNDPNCGPAYNTADQTPATTCAYNLVNDGAPLNTIAYCEAPNNPPLPTPSQCQYACVARGYCLGNDGSTVAQKCPKINTVCCKGL